MMTLSVIEQCQSPSTCWGLLASLMKDTQKLVSHPLDIYDFVSTLQKIIFTAIQNEARNGARTLKVTDIEEFISGYPTKYNLYQKADGSFTLKTELDNVNMENFEKFYIKVKKHSLLRRLMSEGIDVSYYWDPSELDPTKCEEIQKRFDEDSIEKIIAYYQTKIFNVAYYYGADDSIEFEKAGGEELLKLSETWQLEPDFGLSYASQFLTTATMGIKKERLSIMSASPGCGKTRVTIANLCRSFVPEFWDSKQQKWVVNPHRNFDNNRGMNVLYIGTEMVLKEEIEPIIVAYMADVDEAKIKGVVRYGPGEYDRVKHAIEALDKKTDENGNLLKDFGIYEAYMPEYDTASLDAVIKKYVTEHNVGAVFLDYLMTTPKLLAEWRSLSGNIVQREDQALANLSKKLKDMARKYKISIDTCTQLSGDYKNINNRDETIVRGSKAVIDKADTALILSEPTNGEMASVTKLLRNRIDKATPNRVLTLYKNRGGAYNKIKIWLYIDYGTMRVHDLFVTDMGITKVVPIKKSRIIRDVEGNIVVTTDDIAKKMYKDGKISSDTLDSIIREEKNDKSYSKSAEFNQDALKKARADVNDDEFPDVEMYSVAENVSYNVAPKPDPIDEVLGRN